MRRFTLAQLQTALWIARLGGVRAAAERLGVSQPALTQRVRGLERALGGALFARAGGRSAPTALGREVVAYAERFQALADELERATAGDAPVGGTLRLGVADSFAVTALPALLVEIEARHPALRVELSVDYSVELDQRLQAGALDLAVLTAPRLGPLIVAEPCVELSLVWVAPPRLLVGATRVRPRDLVDVPILTNPSPSHLFRTLETWFAAAGVAPRRLNTCSSLTIMARLAAAGAGVALLPPAIARAELDSGALRQLPASPAIPPHTMMIAARRDAPRASVAAVTALIRTLTAQGELAPRRLGSRPSKR